MEEKLTKLNRWRRTSKLNIIKKSGFMTLDIGVEKISIPSVIKALKRSDLPDDADMLEMAYAELQDVLRYAVVLEEKNNEYSTKFEELSRIIMAKTKTIEWWFEILERLDKATETIDYTMFFESEQGLEMQVLLNVDLDHPITETRLFYIEQMKALFNLMERTHEAYHSLGKDVEEMVLLRRRLEKQKDEMDDYQEVWNTARAFFDEVLQGLIDEYFFGFDGKPGKGRLHFERKDKVNAQLGDNEGKREAVVIEPDGTRRYVSVSKGTDG